LYIRKKYNKMARKNIAAGNWKMNTSVSEGVSIFNDISTNRIDNDALVIIAPPFTHLQSLIDQKKDNVEVAAQNCHFENSGAFTGEISPEMLKNMGIKYVILGHSERREYFQESDALLAQKVNSALDNGLHVIFCCGEPLEVRKADGQNNFVAAQLKNGLFHLSEKQLANITIAYEPIWAIGTGETATSQQAQDMHAYLRSYIAENYSQEAANNISILYGGSVKPDNAKELFGQPDVDGGLVGGASLKSDSFTDIIASF